MLKWTWYAKISTVLRPTTMKYDKNLVILTLGSFDSVSFNSKKYLNVEMDLICKDFDCFASKYHEKR